MKVTKIANFGKRVARSGKNQIKSYKDTLQMRKKRTVGGRCSAEENSGGGGAMQMTTMGGAVPRRTVEKTENSGAEEEEGGYSAEVNSGGRGCSAEENIYENRKQWCRGGGGGWAGLEQRIRKYA